MQLSFRLSDDVYEAYVKRFGVKGAYDRMRTILTEMQNVDPADRYILVAGDDRRAIEAVFETTMDDSKKLVGYLNRLNKVKIDNTSMDFNVAELERIDMQASFHGRTREAFINEMIQEIKANFLETL